MTEIRNKTTKLYQTQTQPTTSSKTKILFFIVKYRCGPHFLTAACNSQSIFTARNNRRTGTASPQLTTTTAAAAAAATTRTAEGHHKNSSTTAINTNNTPKSKNKMDSLNKPHFGSRSWAFSSYSLDMNGANMQQLPITVAVHYCCCSC